MTRVAGLSLQSVVCATPQQVSRDLGGEAVVLQLDSGVYYGLDPVGASVWNHLKKPVSVEQLRDAVMAEYDVDAERCERDLMALLDRLLSENLIELNDERLV